MKKNLVLLHTILIALCFLTMNLKAQDSLSAFAIDSGYHVSFDGTKIYYEVRGEGKPVVLIHGFTNTGENWKRKPLYGDLILSGNKVIILDLRGNGKSDKPHSDEGYANDAEAKDIMGLLKFLRVKKYQAVGYSRGSIIAARLLVLDKRLGNTVLGGMGADFTNPEWSRRILFYRALSGETIPELQVFMNNIRRSGLDTMALMYMQKHQPSTSPAQLGKLKQNVLVISGSDDNDNGSAEALAKMMVHAKTIRVPGVHNTTAQTKPFAEAVVQFLNKK